jgi:hypothetical protein
VAIVKMQISERCMVPNGLPNDHLAVVRNGLMDDLAIEKGNGVREDRSQKGAT